MKGGVSGKRTAADERGLGYSKCGWVKGKGSIMEEQFSSKLREDGQLEKLCQYDEKAR